MCTGAYDMLILQIGPLQRLLNTAHFCKGHGYIRGGESVHSSIPNEKSPLEIARDRSEGDTGSKSIIRSRGPEGRHGYYGNR